MRSGSARVGAVAVLYAVLVGVFVLYVASLDLDDSFSSAALVGLGALQLAAGIAIGWRALALLPVLPLLALPVPVPEGAYEPLPLWFFMLAYAGPVALVLMVVGALAHETIERRRRAGAHR